MKVIDVYIVKNSRRLNRPAIFVSKESADNYITKHPGYHLKPEKVQAILYDLNKVLLVGVPDHTRPFHFTR